MELRLLQELVATERVSGQALPLHRIIHDREEHPHDIVNAFWRVPCGRELLHELVRVIHANVPQSNHGQHGHQVLSYYPLITCAGGIGQPDEHLFFVPTIHELFEPYGIIDHEAGGFLFVAFMEHSALPLFR